MKNNLQDLINTKLVSLSLDKNSKCMFREELGSHIFEKATELILLGKTEKEAINVAFKDFGNVNDISTEIESIHQGFLLNLVNFLIKMIKNREFQIFFIILI
ncbi:hypothetical protein JW796_00040 [Candidatus Dojkabacteria bacterium]|nr:hypothetical protein [Candidatus Dojkabacteria bacterium]